MIDSAEVKRCCAAAYQSEFARLLLGDSFHPGGLGLTERLGELLALKPGQRVLDLAAGTGESAIFLAGRFGCEVLGIDLGEANVAEANTRAKSAERDHLVRFQQGDAEQIAELGPEFDAVICECAFCTFPNKQAAARGMAQALRPGGRIGLSDLTRSGPLPSDLEGLLAWIACIADARPITDYTAYLEAAGCHVVAVEPHDEALAQMVRDIQGRLLASELMVKLKKFDLPGADFDQAKALARAAAGAIGSGVLGYSLVIARMPPIPETV